MDARPPAAAARLQDLLAAVADRRLRRRQRHLSLQGGGDAPARRGVGRGRRDRRGQHRGDSTEKTCTTGHNTDRSGLSLRLPGGAGRRLRARRLSCCWSPAAPGCAVAFALMDMGAALLRIHDPGCDACQQTLRRPRRRASATQRCVSSPASPQRCAVVAGVVNATPVGMLGHPGMPMTVEPHPAASLRGRRHLHAAQLRRSCRLRELDGSQRDERQRHVRASGRRGVPPLHRPSPDVARMKRTFARSAPGADAPVVRDEPSQMEEETVETRPPHPGHPRIVAGQASRGIRAAEAHRGASRAAPLAVALAAPSPVQLGGQRPCVSRLLSSAFLCRAPPVGRAASWKPPPATPWQGGGARRAATSAGRWTAFSQSGGRAPGRSHFEIFRRQTSPISERFASTLNVWAPTDAKDLPVMVWTMAAASRWEGRRVRCSTARAWPSAA